MKYLDLFSGIGGFPVGINEAYAHQVPVRDAAAQGDGGADAPLPGAPSAVPGSRPERDSGGLVEPGDAGAFLVRRPECVGFSEIDRHASSVYQRNFPGHNALGDITRIDAATLPDFDLLVGGFPCQSFSVAGKRLGFDDTRGTLFFEIARILAVKKPRNFVLENVRGLLSHDAGRTFRTILATLNDLGYGVEWQVLNSKDFGVPQNRERVYLVGHLGGIPERKVFPLCGADRPTEAERVTATTLDANYFKGIDNHGARTGVAVLQDVRGLDKKQNGKGWKEDGPSYTVDTLATQGIVVHNVGDSPTNHQIATGVNRPSRGPEPRTDGNACAIKAGESGTKNQILVGYKGHTANTPDAVAKTLKAGKHGVPGGEGLLNEGYRIRRLTPKECCRLQAFPDSWVDFYADGKPVSDSQKYKMLGNAVTTSVVAAVIGRLLAVDNSLGTETSRA